ncbi:MAG: SDR family oxidoreductase [Xanthomonadales bacterium]|nr:SDR family oxidoreductase [Xanthomonadales bacterium]
MKLIKTLVVTAIVLLGGLTGCAPANGEASLTVLVTGANRGLGLEFARQFHERGYQVIGTARKPGSAEELKALGVRVEQLDVTDAGSVKALAERLSDLPIDILINNAGISGHGPASFLEHDFDQLGFTFEVNSLGPMRVTQALFPNLESGDAKKVVHITSRMGSIELNGGGYYGYRASKAALNMLNKSLSAELGAQGFVCVVLHPGWVQTDMGGPNATLTPQQSIAGMIRVIDGLDSASNGGFFDYQGEEIPW